MPYYDVSRATHRHEEPFFEAEDEWSRPNTSTSYQMRSLYPTPGEYGDILVPFSLEEGKDYYLVYVVYSTGDSFGHDAGAGLEFIEVYETYEKARATQLHLQADYSLDSYHYMQKVNYKNELEEIRSIARPWVGYFESLDTVELVTLRLEKP